MHQVDAHRGFEQLTHRGVEVEAVDGEHRLVIGRQRPSRPLLTEVDDAQPASGHLDSVCYSYVERVEFDRRTEPFFQRCNNSAAENRPGVVKRILQSDGKDNEGTGSDYCREDEPPPQPAVLAISGRLCTCSLQRIAVCIRLRHTRVLNVPNSRKMRAGNGWPLFGSGGGTEFQPSTRG